LAADLALDFVSMSQLADFLAESGSTNASLKFIQYFLTERLRNPCIEAGTDINLLNMANAFRDTWASASWDRLVVDQQFSDIKLLALLVINLQLTIQDVAALVRTLSTRTPALRDVPQGELARAIIHFVCSWAEVADFPSSFSAESVTYFVRELSTPPLANSFTDVIFSWTRDALLRGHIEDSPASSAALAVGTDWSRFGKLWEKASALGASMLSRWQPAPQLLSLAQQQTAMAIATGFEGTLKIDWPLAFQNR